MLRRKNQACARHIACRARIFLAHLKALTRSSYFRFLKLIGSSKFKLYTLLQIVYAFACHSDLFTLICALTLIFESLIALVIFFEFHYQACHLALASPLNSHHLLALFCLCDRHWWDVALDEL